IGFLQGWAYFLVVATGAIAALALVFAEYVSFFVPMGPGGQKALAIGALAVLAMVNVGSVRAAASLSGLLTVLKLAALAALVIAGFVAAPGHDVSWRAGAAPAPASTALAAAMIGVLWSYGGWQHATFAAGEARRPTRDVALGVIAA